MQSAFAEIAAALRDYFDGFYLGDIDRLRRIFHPNCHLYSATDGVLQDDDMEAVYARVRGRENPGDRGDLRFDAIVAIDFSGPETALAKVQIAVAPKLFTDFLTLVRIDGEWRIITKTYTHVPMAGTSA